MKIMNKMAKDTILQALTRWVNVCDKDVSELVAARDRGEYIPYSVFKFVKDNADKLNEILEYLEANFDNYNVVFLNDSELENRY